MNINEGKSGFYEPYVLRAAAIDGEAIRCLPREQIGSAFESGGDVLAASTLTVMEFLVGPLGPQECTAMGLVFGTTLGCLEIDREFDRSRRPAEGRYASPAAFARTLPSTVAAEVALRFGIVGPSLVLSGGDCSGALALRRAAVWMDHFDLNLCAAGAMDWTGGRIGEREGCRAVVLLLGRAAEHSIGRLRVGTFIKSNLEAVWDTSLDRLSAWVADPVDTDIGGGIRLVRTHLPIAAADQ